jgi:IclR family transcriptional regulator, acetate operon repressor
MAQPTSRSRSGDGSRAAPVSPGVLDKAIDILFELHAAGLPRSLTQIAVALGMPKSSVHRLLAALGRRALIERDAGGQYRLGVGVIALGLGVLEREPVVQAARPVLEIHARELGETFFLVSARAGALTVLDKVEGTGMLRAAPRVGEEVPLEGTASGKLYLAFAPEHVAAARDALDEKARPRDATARRRALERVRVQGWASNHDEWIPGLSVIGAPIRESGSGRMHGVVATAIATAQLAARGEGVLVPGVRDAARRVGLRLEGKES